VTLIPPAPSLRLATSWGDITASCDHPHHIRFHAGTDGTDPLEVDGFRYIAGITAHRDGPGDPDPRQRMSLTGTWYILATDAWLALSHPDGVAAITRHQQMFIDRVLPQLAEWLATDTAADLVAEGSVHWRRQCVTWAASTEADLMRAVARVRKVRDAIATGQFPTAEDERYLRYARVHPR
jgi:hypothetical protein